MWLGSELVGTIWGDEGVRQHPTARATPGLSPAQDWGLQAAPDLTQDDAAPEDWG